MATRKTKIRTIDIQGKGYRDRACGTTYMSGIITVNFCMEGERTYYLHFEQGCNESYLEQRTLAKLIEVGEIKEQYYSLWEFCDKKKVIKRTSLQTGKGKKETLEYGQK